MGALGRRTIAGTTAAAATAAAVALLGVGTATAPRAVAAPGLVPFGDCDSMRDWYVDAALRHVTAWGLGDSYFAYRGPMIQFEAAGDAVAPVAKAPEASGTTDAVGNGETGTNVQEQGVDEPDIAKTNGEIAAVLRRGELVVYDVTGDHPVETSTLRLPARHRPTELLLVGDRVLLLSPGYLPYLGGPVLMDGLRPMPWQVSPRTRLTTVDVSNPAAPVVVDTMSYEGSLISAREHDGTARVVTTSTPTFDFVYPNGRRSESEAERQNRRIIRESQPIDWLPTVGRGDAARALLACDDVQHPEKSGAFGTITVLTLDPRAPGDVDATGLSADGSLVYSSADRLYVATAADGFWEWGPLQSSGHTDIHAFDVSGTTTRYVASGSVKGSIPDRWAFSEYEGDLRVASSLGSPWSPRESAVSVLQERGNRLVVVGSVAGMGEDEQIQAVRWFGDVAVVVTFRQVDPLYTLDLSDSTHPRIVGELKIPGFSAYLHPLGDDVILGVGQDASREGELRSSQLSTFDLSDLARPRRLAALPLRPHTYSTVEDDSRAFTYLPDQRLAFVPVSDWDGHNRVVAVRVSADGALAHVASIGLTGWSGDTRVLPVDADTVALVSHGAVVRLLDPGSL